MEVRAEREGGDGWEVEITEAHSWEIESKFVCMSHLPPPHVFPWVNLVCYILDIDSNQIFWMVDKMCDKKI